MLPLYNKLITYKYDSNTFLQKQIDKLYLAFKIHIGLPLGTSFRFLDSLNQENNNTMINKRPRPPTPPPIMTFFLFESSATNYKNDILHVRERERFLYV